jgi:hypothetical protein
LISAVKVLFLMCPIQKKNLDHGVFHPPYGAAIMGRVQGRESPSPTMEPKKFEKM